MDFRLRKPRPQIAQADPEPQTAHKKTPGADGGCDRGSLRYRRSALPKTRLSMPDVDSVLNQGPCLAGWSHAAQRRIFWRGAIARWEVSVLPRNCKFNGAILFAFMKSLRCNSIRTGRRVVVIADNAKYH